MKTQPLTMAFMEKNNMMIYIYVCICVYTYIYIHIYIYCDSSAILQGDIIENYSDGVHRNPPWPHGT